MPAIYAHHQFGEQVYAALNESLQELIAPHKTAFQIGRNRKLSWSAEARQFIPWIPYDKS